MVMDHNANAVEIVALNRSIASRRNHWSNLEQMCSRTSVDQLRMISRNFFTSVYAEFPRTSAPVRKLHLEPWLRPAAVITVTVCLLPPLPLHNFFALPGPALHRPQQ
jgi:hypothetical protein